MGYGLHPNKRGHDAIREARSCIKQGYRWVINMDLEKVFYKVNHDRLMRTLSKRIQDPIVLKLIRRYLQAAIMEGGLVRPNTEGGPLSPLFSTIVLEDELDKELEERELRFVRYGDDCNICSLQESRFTRDVKHYEIY